MLKKTVYFSSLLTLFACFSFTGLSQENKKALLPTAIIYSNGDSILIHYDSLDRIVKKIYRYDNKDMGRSHVDLTHTYNDKGDLERELLQSSFFDLLLVYGNYTYRYVQDTAFRVSKNISLTFHENNECRSIETVCTDTLIVDPKRRLIKTLFNQQIAPGQYDSNLQKTTAYQYEDEHNVAIEYTDENRKDNGITEKLYKRTLLYDNRKSIFSSVNIEPWVMAMDWQLKEFAMGTPIHTLHAASDIDEPKIKHVKSKMEYTYNTDGYPSEMKIHKTYENDSTALTTARIEYKQIMR